MKADLWFKRKKYGWGWTPANGKGWAVMALYTVAIMLYPFFIEKEKLKMSIPIFLGITVVLTLGLIWICYLKGEKPSWNWGNQDHLD